MAMYTMELREIANNKSTPIFNFNYPFYCDDKQVKKEFEELFINRYYFHEIGAETYDRWKHQLKTRLCLIMPYYAQLYQTEWTQVGKDMMNSKDLIETTTHTLTSNQTGSQEQQATSESNSQSEGSQSETSESNSNSEGSGTETSEANSQANGNGEGATHSTELESALDNGVPQVHLETDLTRKTQSDSTSTSTTEATSQSDSSSTSTTKATSQSDSSATTSSESTSSNKATNESTMTNQQQNQLEETTTFTSKGDIGIQTPAYAIAEWRKVIININEMILNECKDLFMQIY